MILHGNCLDILPMLDADSFDSAVTDPPYGLSKEPDMAEVLRHWLAGDDYEHNSKGFMGKSWDSFVPGPSIWREVYRVLKPGGHVLAFFGTRTYDMGVLAMRLAGFEIRDQVQWLYGQGFCKSHSVSLALWKGVIDCQSKNNAPYVVQLSKFTHLIFEEAMGSIVVAPALILPEAAPALIIQTGEAGVTLGLTVTSLSASQAESISLSTGWSWVKPSVESLDPRNISTTETSGRVITDQRISTSLTSSLTQKFTPRNVILQNGWTWPAVSVEALSPDAYTSSNDIPIVTVAEIATWNPVAQHEGVGTGLKPANEPIVVARKPLIGTVAENVLAHGVGGLNIDGCRIGDEKREYKGGMGRFNESAQRQGYRPFTAGVPSQSEETFTAVGRWPANLILSYPEDEYQLDPSATEEQIKELWRWFYENA